MILRRFCPGERGETADTCPVHPQVEAGCLSKVRKRWVCRADASLHPHRTELSQMDLTRWKHRQQTEKRMRSVAVRSENRVLANRGSERGVCKAVSVPSLYPHCAVLGSARHT